MEQKLTLWAEVPSNAKGVKFECGEAIKSGQKVVLETEFGLEIGIVKTSGGEKKTAVFVRKATESDEAEENKNLKKAEGILAQTRELVKKCKLEMRPFRACLTLDDKRILVMFTSEGRVDFRELVKAMATTFKRRIELRQVGPRDEIQVLKTVGVCGRECCCGAFLTNFNHVSIKMAKAQGLSLVPSNISGACGKLLCCLEYENSAYLEVAKSMPKIGQEIVTTAGQGRVMFNNLVKKTVIVKVGDDNKEFALEEVKFEKK